MLDDVLLALLGLLVMFASSVARPERASCPPAFYVEGVRPSGATTCREVPPPDRGCAGSRRCPDAELGRGIPMQIYCTGGSVPIVIDARTVGCTRRFGS